MFTSFSLDTDLHRARAYKMNEDLARVTVLTPDLAPLNGTATDATKQAEAADNEPPKLVPLSYLSLCFVRDLFGPNSVHATTPFRV